MPKYAVLWKEVGETPLQAIERFRKESHIRDEVPLAYAGRLDPMADGKLLVVIGDECKQQTKYHSLDKQYLFTVLFGFQSDTYDILGIAHTSPYVFDPHENMIRVRAHTGTITLPYPAFSARTVRGIPLHERTLGGTLEDGETPTKTSRVYSLSRTGIETISAPVLLERILSRINSFPEVTDPRKELGRDFRRSDVRTRWNELLGNSESKYTLAHFSCICSSGTYMRSLAHAFGGLSFSITRTKIGTYVPLPFELGFWSKEF